MKLPPKLVHILAFLALLGYVALVGALVGAWNVNPPAGYTGDTFKQLYKAKFVKDFFPNLSWDFWWGAGIPSFRAYPLLPYYVLAGVSTATGFSLESSLVAIAFVAYTLIGLGTYLATYCITRNYLISFSTALFLLSTPAIWSVHVVNGLFNEILGAVFVPFVLLLGFKITEKIEEGTPAGGDFRALVLLSAAAVAFHPLIGMASILAAIVVILFSYAKIGTRIALSLGGLLLVLGLDLFLILPVVTSSLANVGRVGSSIYLTWNMLPSLFALSYSESSFTLQLWEWPVVIATVVFAAYAGVAFRRRTIALVIFSVLSVIFITVTGQLAVNFVSFVLLIFFLPITTGTLLGLLSKSARNRGGLLALVLTISILLASIVSPIALSIGMPGTVYQDPSVRAAGNLQLPHREMNYRVAISGADAWTSEWFNYRFEIPQTSSYAGLSLINLDWNSWFAQIWQNRLASQQTEFLLDWWGVKWVLIDTDINHPTNFLQNPKEYELLANVTEDHYLEFEYTKAAPIVAPTNSRAILVVGDEAAYRNFLQALSFDAFGSQSVVPITEARNLEDYSLDDLRAFDAVLLYGFAFHDMKKSSSILDEYVREGGSVLIDTGYSGVSTSSELPESFPISRTYATNFGMTWQFSAATSRILDGIDTAEFAPAVYGTDPWGISASTNESVRGWANIILWDAGRPVVVAGTYGEGKVLWSGLNLPYHILSYRNQPESHLLSQMIEWAIPSPAPVGDFEIRRLDPQHLTVLVKSSARGILFKENFFPGWKAFIHTGGLREIKVWKAGPDFMYLRIPNDAKVPLEVSFQFNESFMQTVGVGLSALFLVIIILPRKILHRKGPEAVRH